MVTPPHTPQRETSHTMPALTTKEFITWANRLTGLPWPMTTKEFARIALGEFDWKIGEDKEDFLVNFSSGAESFWIESNEDGYVDQIFIPLLVCNEGDVGKTLCVNDYFAEYKGWIGSLGLYDAKENWKGSFGYMETFNWKHSGT